MPDKVKTTLFPFSIEENRLLNLERKVKNRKLKSEARGKHFYANGHYNKDIDRSTILPEEYTNRIIADDSLCVLQNLPDNCVDLILTSPPYNFGVEYQSEDDAKKWDDYFNRLFAIFDECIRVLKHGGRLIINIQPLFSDYIPTHHIISSYLMGKHLIWKGEILWEKNNYNCKYTAWGSWKSPSSPYFKYSWEFIEIFCKGTMIKHGDKDNIDISADEFKEWVYGKWAIAPERNMKKYNHPAMFPEKLVKRIIKLFSYVGDTVIDPFNGVGTTTYMADLLQRKYLGIDISEEYCKTAKERIESNGTLIK